MERERERVLLGLGGIEVGIGCQDCVRVRIASKGMLGRVKVGSEMKIGMRVGGGLGTGSGFRRAQILTSGKKEGTSQD